jgi:N6-adenosine-specific RNA methylase IME4
VQLAEETGYAQDYLRQLKWVASRIPMEVRRDFVCDRTQMGALAFGHFRVVAPLDPGHQRRFLTIARDGKLNEKSLRETIKTANALAEALMNGADPEGDLDETLALAAGEAGLKEAVQSARDRKTAETKQRREERHKAIAEASPPRSLASPIGPFALIYADPPWTFETYSDKGLSRSPENHYPTLSDEAIIGFKIGDKMVHEMVATSAGLFMWATVPKLESALMVMRAWGFEYSSNAVWIKDRSAHGYVFLNQHELLLYGRRGNFPLPMHTTTSVFEYPKGRHSEKPVEIRRTLETMYPHFDERHRLEMFAREPAIGWTVFGNEV